MQNTIYITGGAGFIGSTILSYLNKKGYENIVIIDNLNTSEKWKNLVGKKYKFYYSREEFIKLVEENEIINPDDIIIHMGACSATTETDTNFLMENNTKFSWKIYERCKFIGARMIYASSAATYGNGEKGYDDNIFDLKPLNMYGYSKQLFDEWVLKDTNNFKNLKISQIVGLKFFNVYGPNEYHKGKMASVVKHGFRQIKENGKIKLFKSYKKGIANGEQKRDFIYIKDILKIVDFFLNNKNKSGIFNAGTGKARTFKDLAIGVFKALNLEPNIEFIEMPETLREKYQYFTEAKIDKLKNIGYNEYFYSLEEGIKDYVQNFLDKDFKNY